MKLGASTALSSAGSDEQKKMEKLAATMNEALPDNVNGGLVLGALMLMVRAGFDGMFGDPEERLRIYDELTAGNRALMAKDAGIKSQ